MKRIFVCLLFVIFLFGCDNHSEINDAMQLREKILAVDGCEFFAEVTADYGDKIYSFSMVCSFDNEGNMYFNVSAPETISGITGTVKANGGQLTFDEQAIAFPLLADDQLTPISAPWIFMRSIRSGYIHSGGRDENDIYLCLHDNYEEDALQVDIWLNNDLQPKRAEILWKNRRILSINITDFTYL